VADRGLRPAGDLVERLDRIEVVMPARGTEQRIARLELRKRVEVFSADGLLRDAV
jgi:hypothetical protein